MGLIRNKIPTVHKMFTTISSYCASSTECVNVHRQLMTIFQYEMKFNKFGHAGLGTCSQSLFGRPVNVRYAQKLNTPSPLKYVNLWEKTVC